MREMKTKEDLDEFLKVIEKAEPSEKIAVSCTCCIAGLLLDVIERLDKIIERNTPVKVSGDSFSISGFTIDPPK